MEKLLSSILFLAAGTYVVRLLPLLLTIRRQNSSYFHKNIHQLFEYMTPSLIVSLFVISIAPLTRHTLLNVLPLISALAIVLISQIRWKNPGISVLIGVAVYAGVSLLCCKV